MDDVSRIVARLPFSFAGPAKLTTTSEVAMIQYLQRKTSIPIPKILGWSDDASNSVGREYIIMEHVTGVQLHQRWPHLKEMVDLDFPAYGSLHPSTLSLDSSSNVPLEDCFCIGPHCGTRYWDCGDNRFDQHTPPNQGPWLNLASFSVGLIDAGLSRIPFRDSPLSNKPPYQGSFQTHLGLLQDGRAVLDAISTDNRVQEAAVPTLFHPDLHKRNIFVSGTDPTTITGIIDWQSCSIEPALWYADELPDFVSDTSSPPTSEIAHSDLCAKAYDACIQYHTPNLGGSRLLDEVMFRPFWYCYRTWKDGAVASRDALIETCKDWTTLGFAGSCPLALPSTQEMALHQKEFQCFDIAQNPRLDFSSFLDCATDGWIPPEHWEVGKAGNAAMFEGMLRAVLDNKDVDDDEPVRDEKDLRVIWPFDLPGQ